MQDKAHRASKAKTYSHTSSRSASRSNEVLHDLYLNEDRVVIGEIYPRVAVIPSADRTHLLREFLRCEDVVYLDVAIAVFVEGGGNGLGRIDETHGRSVAEGYGLAVGAGVEVTEDDGGQMPYRVKRLEPVEGYLHTEEARLVGNVVEMKVADADHSAARYLAAVGYDGDPRAG